MKLEPDLRGPFRTEDIAPEVELIVRLRNHLAVVTGANQLMADQWNTLTDDERLTLLSLALRGSADLAADITDYSDTSTLAAEDTPLQW